MKAVTYSEYGLPDVLQLKEVEKPAPRANEVLLKVRAVSLNASDWEMLTGTPLYSRIWGWFKPKFTVLGSDIAGTVEAVGKEVTQFKVGDAVYGDNMTKWGGFAEYVCMAADKLLPKPEGISFEVASCIPQAATLALQGLRDFGQIQEGQTVLINGGGGGTGLFAIQLAKMYGATVIGVDNPEKLETMRSLGADKVIDYTQENCTESELHCDLILDLVACRSIFDYERILNPKGRYVVAGGAVKYILQALLPGPIKGLFTGYKMQLLTHQQNHTDLAHMTQLIESGKITAQIDRCFPLEKTHEALNYQGNGHSKGKVVVTI